MKPDSNPDDLQLQPRPPEGSPGTWQDIDQMLLEVGPELPEGADFHKELVRRLLLERLLTQIAPKGWGD